MTNKKWSIVYMPKARKIFARLDKINQKRIDTFLYKTLPGHLHPTRIGIPLSGPLEGFWRYRVGDYRLICKIKNSELIVLVMHIDHRSQVYKRTTLH